MVTLAAMVGWVLQRRCLPADRPDQLPRAELGLISTAAVVPTIWVMQQLRDLQDHPRTRPDQFGVRGLSFCVLLFRAFVATIPRELDEAALLDGAGPVRLFFRVILRCAGRSSSRSSWSKP